MKPAFRWHWGYLPIILLMGLLWYEYWTSSRDFAPPATRRAVTSQPATTAAPVIAAAPLPVEHAPQPTPPPAVPPSPRAVPAPPVAVAPAPQAGEPPLVSLTVNNASLTEVANALNTALSLPRTAQFAASGTTRGIYTIDAKDRLLWEVILNLNAQSPISLSISRTTETATNPPDSRTIVQRYMLSQTASSLQRGQVAGPVLIYPTNCTFAKTGTGVVTRPPSANPGSYNYSFTAIVDPRLVVTRFDSLTNVQITDDAGRVLTGTATNPVSSATNSTAFAATWTESDTPSKTVTLKGELHFAAQAPDATEVTATVEDAQTKVGDPITLGDHHIRLSRFDIQGSTLQLGFDPEPPEPASTTISFTITDSAGRTVVTSTNRPLTAGNAASLSGFKGPFRIVVRAAGRTNDFTAPFELKDLQLP